MEELLVVLLGAPVDEVGGIQSDAKEIGGDKTKLCSADTNDADYGAVESGHNPALPEFLAEEDSAQNGQDAGEIIESNHVKHIEHFGLLGRSRNRSNQSTGALGFPALLTRNSFLVRLSGNLIPGPELLGQSANRQVLAGKRRSNCEATSDGAWLDVCICSRK